MVAAAPAGVENGTDRAGATIISNRMPGQDFGLGGTADVIRSAVESGAKTMTLVKNAGWRGAGP